MLWAEGSAWLQSKPKGDVCFLPYQGSPHPGKPNDRHGIVPPNAQRTLIFLQVHLIDVGPTIAYLLDLSLPGVEGRVLTEAFVQKEEKHHEMSSAIP